MVISQSCPSFTDIVSSKASISCFVAAFHKLGFLMGAKSSNLAKSAIWARYRDLVVEKHTKSRGCKT